MLKNQLSCPEHVIYNLLSKENGNVGGSAYTLEIQVYSMLLWEGVFLHVHTNLLCQRFTKLHREAGTEWADFE